MSKIEILCTLGPASFNKKFLNSVKREISLVRLNMSHLSVEQLKKKLVYLCKIISPSKICLDTEGAQIRSSLKGKIIYFEKNDTLKIFKDKGRLKLYPFNVFKKIKTRDVLEIGFEGLITKVIKKNNKVMKLKVINPGYYENNKGIHVKNRKIKLNFLTQKDYEAIKIAKSFNIKNYALSFTNHVNDIIKFKSLVPNCRRIYKIETLNAVKNIKKFQLFANDFLIDRGDLSKDVGITNTPIVQRFIFKNKRKKTKISVATNFLESMVKKPYPTRAELNDIYNSLELGASGLVLAAETAIGSYPDKCVYLLKDLIKKYSNAN